MPARWTEYPFPTYSYVTGHFPHPLRDPSGHGCNGPAEPKVAPTNATWSKCEMYLWGIDLFNAGFYWEAHEAWESVWHCCDRVGPIADFLKALIKLAAAGVKARENRMNGIVRHCQRANELFELVHTQLNSDTVLGLSIPDLVEKCAATANEAEELTKLAGQDLRAPVLSIRLTPA